MKKIIKVETKEPVILQCTDLIFSQKPYWCNATRVPLKMSILHQRAFFEYDDKPAPQPCILWITGGGWTEVDQNVWLPELSYYAKKGYVVASGVLPVNRTIKNNKFLYRQPIYGWRYF